MYKWVDQRGEVTYSRELPADIAGVRELGVLEGTGALSPYEQRTIEIINAERRKETAPNPPEEYPLHTGTYPASRTDASPGGSAMRRPGATETVRDPCILSPDPRCHEKHAADYDPYHGYAPSLLRAQVEAPIDTARTRSAGAAEHNGSR